MKQEEAGIYEEAFLKEQGLEGEALAKWLEIASRESFAGRHFHNRNGEP